MRVHFISKGPIEQVSGGYIYNRQVVEYLRQQGVAITYHPDTATLPHRDAGSIIIVDGLLLADAATTLAKMATAPVLLMHMAVDGDAELLQRSRIIATGESTQAFYRAISPAVANRTVLIEPGVPAHWQPAHSAREVATNLLCLANYVQGKGHGRLLDVLSRLTPLPWTLQLHGNVDLDPAFFADFKAEVIRRNLQGRIIAGGAVPHEEVLGKMQRADLLLQFSAAESYSMVTAEAIACGLPVLSTRTGNWKTFAASGLVQYLDDDLEATTQQLATLITDAARYQALLGNEPRKFRSWRDVGREFLGYLESIS